MKKSMKKAALAAGIILVLTWGCKTGPDEEILKTYPTGEKQEVAIYEGKGDDRQIVSRIGYYMNGTVSFEQTYDDSGRIATHRAWWPEGHIRAVREYKDGNLVHRESYDADGVRHLKPEEIGAIINVLRGYPGTPATSEDIAIMETSAGTIKLRLYPDVAPGHSDNFKRLANSGFYDSTTFHRVVPGFVIQGGDILSRDARRNNDGTGSPGYTVEAEFNPRVHKKGTLAMARSNDPNSAGSQFYIALTRLAQLDNRYTVFGEVVEGLEVVDAIAAVPRDSRDNPVKPQRIYRVRVGPPEAPPS